MNHLKKISFSVFLALLFLVSQGTSFADSSYHLLKKIALSGGNKWDYLSFDPVGQRLYVSHGTEVDVLSPGGKILGTLPDTPGVHGVIAVTDAGIGFTSNGTANNVSMFELKSLKILAQVPTGNKPDAIAYDPATGCVYVCNGDGETATVIEASSGGVVSTIPLGGSPEYLAADGKGDLYINLEKQDAVVAINTRARKIVNTWTLPAGSNPSSMAIDKANGKLFIGCRNKTMVVLDTRSGQVVQSLPIGDHVDATVFDVTTNTIFNSCGEGIITVIHQDAPSTYSVSGTIKTLPGARTMTIDPETHNLYLPAMDGTTFSLLIFGQ
jgi:DNA-binding beta-propeller fold protein YncE